MSDKTKEFTKLYEKVKTSLDKKINDYNKFLVSDKKGYLKENLELFSDLNSNGKLIRGFLIALGYKMLKDNIDYSYDLSLAYEIFQTAILVHDDVIDNDNLRRGTKTIHYANYLKNKDKDEKDAKKTAESIAICIGDYGFFEANRIILEAYKDDPNLYKVFNYYNDIVLKTAEGELIDVALTFDGKYNLSNVDVKDKVMLVYKLKTAFYTIIGPLSLGLLLGGLKEDKLEDIKKFGEKIGIAFQIQDDILGIYSDMGKVIGTDIKEFKQTILFSYVHNQKTYLDELLKYYGKEELDEKTINETRRIFKESGALDYANDLMNKLYDESLEILNNISWIKEEDKNIIYGFVDYLRNRKK